MLEEIMKMLQGGQPQGGQPGLSPEFQRQLASIPGFDAYIDPGVINSGGEIIPASNRLGGPGAAPASLSPMQGRSAPAPPSPAGVQSPPAQPMPAPQSRPAPSRPDEYGGSGIGMLGTLLSAAPGPIGGVGKMLIGLQQQEQAKMQTNSVYRMLIQSGVSPDQAALLARDPKESTKFIRELQQERRKGQNIQTIKNERGEDISVVYDADSGKFVPVGASTAGSAVAAPGNIPQPAGPQAVAPQSSSTIPVEPPPGVNRQVWAKKRAEVLGEDLIKGPERERKRVDSMKSQYQKTNNMLGALDRATKLLNPQSGILGTSIGAFLPEGSTGFGGSIMKQIGGTEYYDMESALNVLKSNLAFKELQEMRANSPTGGALGNVTERELELLSSTMASFNQNQSASSMRENLGIIRPILEKLKGALRNDLGGQVDEGATTGGASAADPARETVAPAVAPPATTMFGGKNYVKRDGKWYAQ